MRVPVGRLGRVARVGITLEQGLVGRERLAGIGLVALRVEHLVVIGHADDVLCEVRFLRAGMQREVAVGGGDGVVKFAGLVIGVGRHDDGSAGLLRIRVVDVDFFVFLGGLAVVTLVDQPLGLAVDDVGRVVVLDGLRLAPERAAAGERACRKNEAEQCCRQPKGATRPMPEPRQASPLPCLTGHATPQSHPLAQSLARGEMIAAGETSAVFRQPTS